jgi:cysteine desulfurase family protein
LIYLDYAATSWPKPAACIRAIEHFIAEIGSNPAYSLHRRARRGDDVIDQARSEVAFILGVKNPENVIFTLNATEALNRVLWGYLERGNRVLASNFEHASVTRPLAALKKRRGIKIERIGDPVNGIIKPEHIHEACAKKPARLLTITHASNVTGTVQPIPEIVKAAHENNCAVLVDTAQTAGVLPVEAHKWGVDFLAFSGHKHLMGPMGTGGFYVRDPDNLAPVIVGSTGYFDDCDTIPDTMPQKFEPGTPNAPGIAGLGASCKALKEKGVSNIRKEQQALTGRVIKAFKDIPGVRLYGPTDPRKRVGVIGFNIGKHHPSEVGDCLDQKFDIMVRTGLCSCHWANELTGTKPDGVVRASLGYFTKEEEVDLLIDAVAMISEELPDCKYEDL